MDRVRTSALLIELVEEPRSAAGCARRRPARGTGAQAAAMTSRRGAMRGSSRSGLRRARRLRMRADGLLQSAFGSAESDLRCGRARRELELCPGPASPTAARRQVREALASWESGEFEWAALGVVSELTTNAELHAKTEFTVRLALDAGLLRIEVSDLSPRRPQPREYSTDATTGRGLSMLSAIARSDGIEAVPGGKTVWCELMPGEARRTWLNDGTGRRHQRARPEAPDQPGRRCLAASVGAGGTSRRARSAADERRMSGYLGQVA
jgi:hypothetical protein